LVAHAKDVAVKESHIGWYDWRRYSNRQEQAMMMGGMVGKITYAGVPGEYLPLLKFCEQTHLGKATTFGLGKIKVSSWPTSLLPSRV
jgi:CRISPR/Cas system endoribonuclease Cas6 (RAMP superfamily)